MLVVHMALLNASLQVATVLLYSYSSAHLPKGTWKELVTKDE